MLNAMEKNAKTLKQHLPRLIRFLLQYLKPFIFMIQLRKSNKKDIYIKCLLHWRQGDQIGRIFAYWSIALLWVNF
jgi:hypothetical protein